MNYEAEFRTFRTITRAYDIFLPWCEKNLKPGSYEMKHDDYMGDPSGIAFEFEEDRLAFKLKFGF